MQNVSRLQDMTKEQNQIIYIQIAISVATLILTPIFSALVVHYQLSKSQDYWKKQQSYLMEKELYSLKADIYSEAVMKINLLNDSITNHQIVSTSREMALILANYLKDKSPEKAKYFDEQYREYRKKTADSYIEMRNKSIVVSSLGAKIKVFFNEEIFKLFIDYRKKAKLAEKNIYSDKEIKNIFLELLQKHGSWQKAKDEIDQLCDQKIDSLAPINETTELLNLMMKRFGNH